MNPRDESRLVTLCKKWIHPDDLPEFNGNCFSGKSFADLNSLLCDPCTLFLLKRVKPQYLCMVLYHGHSHWLYLYRNSTSAKFRALVAQAPPAPALLTEPVIIYQTSTINDNGDSIYAGVKPGDLPRGYEKCEGGFLPTLAPEPAHHLNN